MIPYLPLYSPLKLQTLEFADLCVLVIVEFVKLFSFKVVWVIRNLVVKSVEGLKVVSNLVVCSDERAVSSVVWVMTEVVDREVVSSVFEVVIEIFVEEISVLVSLGEVSVVFSVVRIVDGTVVVIFGVELVLKVVVIVVVVITV